MKTFEITWLAGRSQWLIWFGLVLALASAFPSPKASAAEYADKIDRQALVTRHNIVWNELNGQIPLGNGEFCFNADATGLQTFGGNTESHWGWHSFPLPAGVTPDQIPPTGTFQKGRNVGKDKFPEGTESIRQWMFDNPHMMNLGRLRLADAAGVAFKKEDVSGLTRTLDLWSGVQTSSYQIGGAPVRVETWVDATFDAVVVRVESPLVAHNGLQVVLDFPYPRLGGAAWSGDFSKTDGHQTKMAELGTSRADFLRVVDGTTYHVSLAWSPGGKLAAPGLSPHRFILSASGTNCLAFVCAYSADPPPAELPAAGKSKEQTSQHWKDFWHSGGAIDLSGSRDSRWFELERRIVLSQYLMAAQSAGSFPSAEAGLMELDPWRGQFHMEMVWWHLAHYALWDRWAMADKALGCYQRFTSAARALADQLGYKGLQWGKSVGPEGRSAPWEGNQVLLWKEPHPLFFAELDYRLYPARATLEKWTNVVFGTAEYLADYPTRDAKTGIYHLDPVMPPSEHGITRDDVFDLAYWRYGLDEAQFWRERLGLAREPHWDEVRKNLAPVPVNDGVYVHSAEALDSFKRQGFGHPDAIGVFGMLPPLAGVDAEIAHRTVVKIWQTWNWQDTWGWDFPWTAMAAARCGEPQIAVDVLLKDAPHNLYDQRGADNGWYLPGNGGLLYAVAMMAAGWDHGPDRPAPGFPSDGSWTVKWEGLKKAP